MTRDRAVRDVDLAEKTAHDAQLRLHDARNRRVGIAAALAEYAAAENALSAALVDAWTNYPPLPAAVRTIEEPLQLAVLDLQGELRRRLGPNNHTVVPDLVDDAGCAGDVVQARLLPRFATAAQVPSTQGLGTSDHATVEVLHHMALQVACLGGRQLADLESAMNRGFEDVAGRLRKRGYGPLVPAFARLVAPLQLLVLDVRKARGSLTESHHWFVRHSVGLLDAIDRAGWASGDVFVWDRRRGILVGFAQCSGPVTTECIEYRSFFASLGDPRAIGAGRCGFSAMLSRPRATLPATPTLAGGLRYVCPTATCEDGGTRGPLSAQQRRDFEQIWGPLEAVDFDVIEQLCRGEGFDALGTHRDLASCLDAQLAGFFESQNNPFETFQECILDGIGASTIPDIGAEGYATGVPSSRGCALSDAASETQTSSVGPAAPGKAEVTKVPVSGGGNEFHYISSAGAHYIVMSGTVTVRNVNGHDTPVMEPCSGCTEAQADFAAGALLVGQVIAAEGIEEGRRAARALAVVMMDASGGAVTSPPDGPVRPAYGAQGCADPIACNDDCTGLGRVTSAAEGCTEDLLATFGAAMGRAPKEVARSRDVVSYPQPDDFQAQGGDTYGACTSSGPARTALACGLMMCADGRIASVDGADCACTSPSGTLRTPTSQLCRELRCADGALPDPASCTCPAPDPATGRAPGQPEPRPEAWALPGPATSLAACLADRSAGTFVYDWTKDRQTLSDTFGEAVKLMGGN